MEQTTKSYRRKERLRYFGRGVAWLGLALIGFFGLLGNLLIGLDRSISAIEIVVFGLMALMCFGGSWRAVLSIHHAFNSDSGKLAQSALSQYPGGKIRAEAIFEEIDADLAKDVVAFGKLRVGHTWILGDEAMRLDRVCGIFAEKIYVAGKSPHSIYHLYLVDCDNNLQCNLLTHGYDLDDAVEYLSGRLPRAFVGDIEDLPVFTAKEASERTARLSAVRAMSRAAEDVPTFNFIGADGVPSSNFEWNDVQKALYVLRQGESVGLEVLEPFEYRGAAADALFCRMEETRCMTLMLHCVESDGSQHWYMRENIGQKEAVDFMEAYYTRGILPQGFV